MSSKVYAKINEWKKFKLNITTIKLKWIPGEDAEIRSSKDNVKFWIHP